MTDTARSKSELLALISDCDVWNIAYRQNLLRDVIASIAPPFMGCYVSTAAETSISVAGTTTISNKSDDMDANSANNRIRYTGASPRHFHVVCQASITIAQGNNKKTGLQLWHYDDSAGSGSLTPESHAQTTITTTAIEQITSHADVMMDTNDYLEIHLANHTDTVNLTADFAYLFCVGMMM